jgi:peroxiredoxin
MNPRTLCIVLALSLCIAFRSKADAPRYQFTPGQHITYELTAKYTGSYSETYRSVSQIWVLRGTDDGAWRMLLRQQTSTGGGREDETDAMCFDLSPRGQISNATPSYRVTPERILPPLPSKPDQTTWTAADMFGETSTYKLSPRDPSGAFQIEAVDDGAFKTIYQMNSITTFTFDHKRGYISGGKSSTEQNYGIQSKGSGELSIMSTDQADAAQLADMVADDSVYSAAIKGYSEQMQVAETDPAMAEQGERMLKEAQGKLKSPVLREILDKRLAQHASSIEYMKQSANERAATLNQPAPQFELTDLAGKTHRLADYKGKVVVLDFWYRGCGWCVRAMPQINQIADDFKDQPVVVFGMNTDQKTEDAKFTADAMQLKYDTLLLGGQDRTIVDQLKIRGFPTLVIIGPDGIVRDIHVGWSATLREDVGKAIKTLLSANHPT